MAHRCSMAHGRGWRVSALFLLGISTAGCESIPPLFHRGTASTSEEVADVFVSAYPAIPWSDIGEKLEPAHNLTTEQARGLAAQATQIQVFQFLSTFAAGLGIGLPTRTDSTATSLAADGTQSTTASRTRGTGTPPGSSGMPSSGIADAALAPDLSKGPLSLGLDASTLLTAGTAVYQLGKILDNQISKSFLPKDYQAHLITLQVNLQPKARNLAYDAYVNVSFLPGTWREALEVSRDVEKNPAALPPVVVYPLIISDALETTGTGRSIEAVRQMAFQLLGVIGSVGVNAGASGGTDRLEAVMGSDKNSLVTVGRVSDHSVRIRLGAQNSGSSGVAMVPRTHNVSLVVLTRWHEKDDKQRVTSLSAITDTSLVPADGGAPLQSGRLRQRTVLAEQVRKVVEDYSFGPVVDACSGVSRGALGGLAGEALKAEIEITKYLDLLRAVDRADYRHVAVCLGLGQEGMGIQREVSMRRLLAQLMKIQTSSRYSKLTIPLKQYPEPTLPKVEQLVLMTDDGEASSTLVLRGGRSLRADEIRAELTVKDVSSSPGPARVEYLILPTSVKVSGGGSELQIAFASPSALNLGPSGDKPLLLSHGGKDPIRYAVRKVMRKKEPGASNPVSASSPILVADAGGDARVTLKVGKVPDGFAAPMRLVVSGADVREDRAIGAPGTTSKGVVLAPESAVTLSLGNLGPTRTVSVVTIDDKDKPIGDPLVFLVDRVAQSPR